MSYTIATISQRPDLEAQITDIENASWPRFMQEDPVVLPYWLSLLSKFADFQFVLYDATETVVATGHSIPIVWDGTPEGLPQGWDAALRQGLQDHEHQRTPTALCALAVTIAPQFQGQGLSSTGLRVMRSLALAHGLGALIAPVRPSHKSRYPLTSFERYVSWCQSDGAPFDPWLRTHWRLGGKQLRLAPQSMTISATVAEWESWTNMRFPESGLYIVPGALEPIVIDHEADYRQYVETSVWMLHTITAFDAQISAQQGSHSSAVWLNPGGRSQAYAVGYCQVNERDSR